MNELADILRLHGQSYRNEVPSLSHRVSSVLKKLELCRTAYFGGHVYRCDHCRQEHYAYHSCRDRHCPKCNAEQTHKWLDAYRSKLLGCPYYFLTFTIPSEIRALAYAEPVTVYSALLQAAVKSLQKLADDPKWVGGQLAMMSVLHTWTRALLFHPHVHVVASAGGMNKEGSWVPSKNPAFLVPCFALSKIFRAKFKAAIKKAGLMDRLSANAWKRKWVVHCRHAGSGEKVLEYLARYAFRVALSNKRIEKFENGKVSFRYRDNRSQQMKRIELTAVELIDRFSKHILPKGFVKIRSYGLWHARRKEMLKCLQITLGTPTKNTNTNQEKERPVWKEIAPLCPKCKIGHLYLDHEIKPQWFHPP